MNTKIKCLSYKNMIQISKDSNKLKLIKFSTELDHKFTAKTNKRTKKEEEINSLHKAANMNKLSTATQKEDRKKAPCNSETDPICLSMISKVVICNHLIAMFCAAMEIYMYLNSSSM